MSELITMAMIEQIDHKRPQAGKQFRWYAPTEFSLKLIGRKNGVFQAFRIYIDFADKLYIRAKGKDVYLADDAIKHIVQMNGGMPLPIEDMFLPAGVEPSSPRSKRVALNGQLQREHIERVERDSAGTDVSEAYPNDKPIGYCVYVIKGLEGLNNQKRRMYRDDDGVYIIVKGVRVYITTDAMELVNMRIHGLEELPGSAPKSALHTFNKTVRDMLS